MTAKGLITQMMFKLRETYRRQDSFPCQSFLACLPCPYLFYRLVFSLHMPI